MYIDSAAVDRYGPLYDVRPTIGAGLTVLSGPNEAGKTLYLEALLQLLEPGIPDRMSPGPRVDQPPTGRVELIAGDEHHVFAGDDSLGTVSGIDPAHLQRLFVVRDGDLSLPTEPAYYTSLIETLGDIHTSDIESIQAALRERGRLTPTRLDVSSDQQADNAGTVRDRAETLAEDIRAYLADVDATDLDGLAGRRLQLTSDLQTARERLAVQRDASRVAAHDRLLAHLETVREARAELEGLSVYDGDTLEGLRERHRELEQKRATLDQVRDRLEETESRIRTLESDVSEHEARVAELEGRESAVENLRRELDAFRETQEQEPAVRRHLQFAKRVALVGIGGAAGTGILGGVTASIAAVGLGAALGLVGIGAGGVYHRANRRLEAIETDRSALLAAARDVGFAVETVEDLPPAIDSFRRDLERGRKMAAKEQAALENTRERQSALRDRKREHETHIAELEATQREVLDGVAVDSIEAYETRVSHHEDRRRELETAREQLIDRFGEPEGTSADQQHVWETKIAALVEDVADDIDGADFSEAARDRLETKVDSIRSELERLEDRLEDHDDQLAAFERRARDIDARPFLDDPLSLPARSCEGLESLAQSLETLVERIERDAEVSRKAHELFDRIDAKEQQKLADLLDPDGPASRIFERLTGGRYTAVGYDPDTHSLAITRQDGRTVEPGVLSKATTDQLYFATRVSLAGQLLGNEPGFLLLDDPFLAADPDRLRRGFQSLLALVEDGWQILYFTAKGEVSETMVDEFGLERTELGTSPLSTEP